MSPTPRPTTSTPKSTTASILNYFRSKKITSKLPFRAAVAREENTRTIVDPSVAAVLPHHNICDQMVDACLAKTSDRDKIRSIQTAKSHFRTIGVVLVPPYHEMTDVSFCVIINMERTVRNIRPFVEHVLTDEDRPAFLENYKKMWDHLNDMVEVKRETKRRKKALASASA